MFDPLFKTEQSVRLRNSLSFCRLTVVDMVDKIDHFDEQSEGHFDEQSEGHC